MKPSIKWTLKNAGSEKIQNEYKRYGLAKMINLSKKFLANPDDVFVKKQLELIINYTEKLLGNDNYGIKDGE